LRYERGMQARFLAPLLVVACGPAKPVPITAESQPPTTPAGAPKQPPAPKPSPYPPTEKHAVTDTYFGTQVTDDYRWLEDGNDPKVAAWTAAQNQLTRARLDAIPDRDKLHARVAALMGSKPPSFFALEVRGDQVFALKDQPPKQQTMLVVTGSLDKSGSERVVLDPNVLDATGATTIDFYVPSRDGKKVAISLSVGGTERGDAHIYDVATGQALPDVVTRVNSGVAGGSLAWNAAGTGFWYTRTDDTDFNQQVYFHKLGTPPNTDTHVLGKDFPKIAEIHLQTSDDGKGVLVRVANGDGGEFAFYASDDGATFTQVARFEDKLVRAAFGYDGNLYFLSRNGAPKGSIVRLGKPFAKHKLEPLVAEGDAVIEDFVVTKSHVVVSELVGGPSQLRTYRLQGGKADQPALIELPFKVPSVGALHRIGADDVLYQAQSYTDPLTQFHYSAATGHSTATAYAMAAPFPMDDVEVVRESCTSKDGTQVPVSILRPKGIALDGSHPALLTAYGGYGVSRKPVLRVAARLWLDQGAIYAEANLRGGGELGEAWHEAGKLAKKQNVFDDFYACAQLLVDKGYTKPERLAAIGGSNGGLLMGAEIVQHPEMFRAVVSQVGIYDMLRVELTKNGEFNITEFGTVKEEALFRALRAYSPLHNVKDGVAYPAVLFTTGANDPRVDPYNSRKMTARLQVASSSGRPILLRASADVGHGNGTPLAAAIDETTDEYGFLINELGMHIVTK